MHGYGGNSEDLALMRNELAVVFPDAICLLSESNTNNSNCSIWKMGKNLADEVKRAICDSTASRLSFVGHSMGGLIIRAALPHLADYRNMMMTFVSLS